MTAPTMVAVTGLGLVCPIGTEPSAVASAVLAGAAALSPSSVLAPLADARAGVVAKVPLKDFLVRKKDRKLMARASELALAAAGAALVGQAVDRTSLGIYLGVGREPPDDGESEAALAAAAHDGRLDADRLAGPGRDLYPPLLPLKTLPNMALAHISINLGAMGDNGAWAGGIGAGQRAMVSGIRAVLEGRVPAALVGGADSLVDLGSARDRLRMGGVGPPGEAGAMMLIEPVDSAVARGAAILAFLTLGESAPRAGLLEDLVGDVGAAAVPLALGAWIASGAASPSCFHHPEPGDVSAAISVVPRLA